ncbi:GMC family oxidoreductase N-terminal domain-containing protein [Streptomyces sp. C3-3]|nr:GMC family oxidoreductase N-terminal domain-containing protein [Streptomyces sp. C3-3]
MILAAGSYGSPTLLMRSGVGPAGHLRGLGIPVVADLAGVGGNLQDQPVITLTFRADAAPSDAHTALMQTFLTCASGEDTGTDLHVFPLGPEMGDDGSVILTLYVCLLRPHSRGQVRLRSNDPGQGPRIGPVPHRSAGRRTSGGGHAAGPPPGAHTAPGRPARRRTGPRPRRGHRRAVASGAAPVRHHLPAPGGNLPHGPGR